jgi:tRNA pseudouridine55 synthase
MMGTKTYEARIAFGAATDTDDAEGSVIAAAPVPSEISDEGFARGVLADFVGEQQQIPPQFAAIKQDGKKAYKLARAGMHVELKPRTITIHALRLIAASPQYWDIEADVSKGTYIRALARDLGVAVGSKAHIASLRRTRSGSINMDFAQTLENLEQIDIQTHFLPPSVISISPDTPRPPVIPPVTSDAPSVTLSAAKGLVSDPRINTTVVAQPRVSRSRS